MNLQLILLYSKIVPVLGVVFAPALGDIYYAKNGSGAYKNGRQILLKQTILQIQN